MTPLLGPGVTQKRWMKSKRTTPASGTHVPPRLGGRDRSDCAASGAAQTTTSANGRRLMWKSLSCVDVGIDGALQFRNPQSAIRNWLAPLAHPAVVQHGDDPALLEHFDARRVAVGLAVEDVGDTGIDDELGTHHARRGADEYHLVAHAPRCLDERVHLRVDAAAAPGHGRVAPVREAAGVAVVADREHVLELLVGDHRPDLEPHARGT